jgi:hypothetical protein
LGPAKQPALEVSTELHVTNFSRQNGKHIWDALREDVYSVLLTPRRVVLNFTQEEMKYQHEHMATNSLGFFNHL